MKDLRNIFLLFKTIILTIILFIIIISINDIIFLKIQLSDSIKNINSLKTTIQIQNDQISLLNRILSRD